MAVTIAPRRQDSAPALCSKNGRPGQTESPAPVEQPAAVFLWMDHPRLPLLRRVLAAGAGGRHFVGVCRAADPRIRLVARGPVGGGVAGRAARGAVIAADRSDPRP